MQVYSHLQLRGNGFEAIQVLKEARDSVLSVYVGNFEIITGSIDGCVRTYDIRIGELRSDFMPEGVCSVSMSQDENFVLVGCMDNTVRLIDKNDGSLFHDCTGHKAQHFKVDCCFSNDDEYVYSGSEDGRVYVWKMETGKLAGVIKAHNALVSGVDFHPNKNFMLTASQDYTVKLFGS